MKQLLLSFLFCPFFLFGQNSASTYIIPKGCTQMFSIETDSAFFNGTITAEKNKYVLWDDTIKGIFYLHISWPSNPTGSRIPINRYEMKGRMLVLSHSKVSDFYTEINTVTGDIKEYFGGFISKHLVARTKTWHYQCIMPSNYFFE